MLDILASNNSKIKTTQKCQIRSEFSGKKSFILILGFFNNPKFDLSTLNVEMLDEEKSKSFLGAAGLGFVGAALLGPLGLIAGALAGGNNNNSMFGISFLLDGIETKLIVKTSNNSDIKMLRERSVLSKAS